ncbi:MAG: vWA domain-containing protein [bacterium]|jgi:Ca-activated chloride channel family protein|nr:VWA domain-containing protein [Planctomycetota bacterium]HIL52745.1 VWA domain-containing protein [Planctomycetota bacterium]
MDPSLVAAALAVVLGLSAEYLHLRRLRPVTHLAFGPKGKPSAWVHTVPALRGAASGLLAWGLVSLLVIAPKTHANAEGGFDSDEADKHVLMVLDVSPSMRLEDAGPNGTQSRMHRARDVLDSFLRRIPLEQYRISVVAVYNGAKPVVEDTRDIEVVRNILGDLPLHFAFPSGKTKLFDGIEKAAEIAAPWNPKSTTLVLVSDGDTVPAQGMPRMPASVEAVLVVGVGDPATGKFIDGQQSRQDVSTLRQIATRLGGTFHNGNVKHLSSVLIRDLTRGGEESVLEEFTRREYALAACGLGALILALLPLLLHLFGTPWRPGKRPLNRGPRGLLDKIADLG